MAMEDSDNKRQRNYHRKSATQSSIMINQKQMEEGSGGKKGSTAPSSAPSPYSMNSLWSVWYSAFAVAFQVYIIAKAIERFTDYLSLPWPSMYMPHASLNLYVIFIGLGVVILPFFVVASMMKIGNFANDGRKIGIGLNGAPLTLSSFSHDGTSSASEQGQGRFGRSLFYSDYDFDVTEPEDEDEEDELYNIYANVGGQSKPPAASNTKEKRRPRQSLFARIWTHGPPIAPMLHIVAAFCFLVPRLLMEAQLIKFGFLPKADIWKTELDPLFTLLDDKHLGLFGLLSSFNSTFLHQGLGFIGQEQHHVMNGGHHGYFPPPSYQYRAEYLRRPTTTSEPSLVQSHSAHFLSSISPEFINLCMALVLLAVRYPSVFWRVNKAYGLIFSIQLLLHGLIVLILYSSVAICYKIRIYGPRKLLPKFSSALLLDNRATIILLIVVISIMILIASPTLYSYGWFKYREYRQRRRHAIHGHGQRPPMNRCCWGYGPHLWSFVVLVSLAGCLSPMIYDMMAIYCGTLNGCLLATITAVLFFLLEWIFLWFCLTVKNKWNFAVTGAASSTSSSKSMTGRRWNDGANGGSSQEKEALLKSTPNKRGAEAPLLIVGHGQTFQIRDISTKRAIIGAALKARDRVQVMEGNSPADTEVYWLKPKQPTPESEKPTTSSAADNKDDKSESTLSKKDKDKKKTSSWLRGSKTSDALLAGSSPGGSKSLNRKSTPSKSPKTKSKGKSLATSGRDASDDKWTQEMEDEADAVGMLSDDGDYTILRQIVRDSSDEDHLRPTHTNLCPLKHENIEPSSGSSPSTSTLTATMMMANGNMVRNEGFSMVNGSGANVGAVGGGIGYVMPNGRNGDYELLSSGIPRSSIASSACTGYDSATSAAQAIHQPPTGSQQATGNLAIDTRSGMMPPNSLQQQHSHQGINGHDQAHHIPGQLNMTPRSGSDGSEGSPEKNSETSSGIHSHSLASHQERTGSIDCGSTASTASSGHGTITGTPNNGKRSSSLENIIQAMNSAKQSWRNLSLQRFISSIPSSNAAAAVNQRVAFIQDGSMSDSPYGQVPPLDPNMMVIRRQKAPYGSFGRGPLVHGNQWALHENPMDLMTTTTTTATSVGQHYPDVRFQRQTNCRLTSFAENAEYCSFNSLPATMKTVAVIPPQVPPHLQQQQQPQTQTQQQSSQPCQSTGQHHPQGSFTMPLPSMTMANMNPASVATVNPIYGQRPDNSIYGTAPSSSIQGNSEQQQGAAMNGHNHASQLNGYHQHHNQPLHHHPHQPQQQHSGHNDRNEQLELHSKAIV